MANNTYIFDLSLRQIQSLITSWKEPKFRAKQIYDWLYKKFAASFDDMSDLPKELRQRLKHETTFSHLHPQIDLRSSDNWTRKILFDLPDSCQVETVLMGYESRRTSCISTQAGCGLGCTFCATGQAGLQRNITAGEIVEQVIWFDRILHKKQLICEESQVLGTTKRVPTGSSHTSLPALRGVRHLPDDAAGTYWVIPSSLTNLVFMGMGEPFANYKEVMRAIKILTDPEGYNFGARRITISTVGLVPQILKFSEEKTQVNLAVSLHAATDKLRDTMIPINKKYPLKELIPACREYTKKTHRRISFEWALIDEVNDTEEQAKLLAKLMKGMLCHINLIPLNPTLGFKGHESKNIRIKKFRDMLTRHGIPNTLRLRRGIDINAGCGQLRQANM